MFLAVGWRPPGLWGQLTRVEGLLLEQMWNIEHGILEEAHGREGPWRLLSLASRLCQGWNFTDQVVDVSLNVHKSVCIIVSFFFSPTQMWEPLCTILIWCWSHLKNTLYLCMSPSVRETSSQKACFCFQESPPSPKAFSDMETFKMRSFLPASG